MKKALFILLFVYSSSAFSQTPVGIKPVTPGVAVTQYVEDLPMNYTYTGPISAIAVNPLTSQHIVVAAETGGLFETKNAGVTGRRWKHLSDFKEHEIMDVLITPAGGGENIWVACSNTFEKVKGPLVWRREVSGVWTKIDIAGATQAMPAYRLVYSAYTGKVYAAGSFGVLVMGKTTGGIASPNPWNITQSLGPAGGTIYSLDVLQEGTILAGTRTGIHSLAPSSSWRKIGETPTHEESGFRFCLKADATGKVAVALGFDGAAGKYKAYSTVDNGRSLQAFPTTIVPMVGGAGGIRSIYPDFDFSSKKLSVYMSNQYDVNYAVTTGNTVQEALTSMQSNAALSWSSQITGGNIGHADTRQIAFLRQGIFPAKMIVTSDGGFHIADIVAGTAPGSYRWQTENTNSGLKSIQLTAVTGKNRDLFFATWHNGFGASLDGGSSFYNGQGGEGIVLSKQGVRGQWDDRIFVTDGIGAQIRNSREIFNIPRPPADVNWNSPPNRFTSGGVPGPVFCTGNTYVEQTNASAPNMFTWHVTTDAGARWNVIGNSPLRRYGFITSIGERPGTAGSYSIIVPVLDRSTIKIVSINNPASGSPTITQPRLSGLSAGIGGLNLGNTENAIFGANPFNALEMMACDNATGKLMRSTNGGDSFSELTAFTEFYNDMNEPGLKSSMGYNSLSCISYSPFTNGVVLAATLSQGVFLSSDGGTTWKKLINPGVLMSTTIHWVSANQAVISTYGRGLFRVRL
jgi:hypothetical protein